jgi:hypothetical protein
MKTNPSQIRLVLTLVCTVSASLLTLIVGAQTPPIYSNGPINGTIDAYNISRALNTSFSVSDSFTVSSTSSLVSAQVALWLDAGYMPTSVDWAIGTSAFASDISSGTAVLSNTFFGKGNSQFDVYSSTFSLNGALTPGTYYFSLSNATSTGALSVFWDINNGPSSAEQQSSRFGTYPIASESFTLYGAAPQPGPMSGTTCNGVYSGNFNGNLTVSNGQDCTFLSGGVNGNVTVGPGATFRLNGASTTGNVVLHGGGNLILNGGSVGGNVQINGGRTFSISSSSIKGNLQIQNIPSGGGGPNQICESRVGGNVQLQNNGTPVDIGGNGCPGNIIGGNLQVQNNSAAVDIFGNTIAKNLQCGGNTPPPSGGSNSAVAKQGQCSGF